MARSTPSTKAVNLSNGQRTKLAVPQSVMMKSLKGTSILAARTWKALQQCETPEQEEAALSALWQIQENQEAAIDAHADLADQLDAEMVAVKARMESLIKIHMVELDRLTRWREKLDQTILQLNETGMIGTDTPGQTRRIRIKENPPSCEILDLEQVPEQFVTEQTKIERKADKAAIKKAWLQGVPVSGVRIERRRKVVYELAPTNLTAMTGNLSH